ncbi:hypothetical protein [Pseudomonas veronii]|uniref:hypothetical protein n=1 Tax=Pseudomonas veronii TaxID=76761 RepID=UPI00061DBC56|nr:hypothetical protein [Pseudomonas veronii]WKC46140.1 hypothetical protein QYP03_25470 [Pseudomonas veronii]
MNKKKYNNENITQTLFTDDMFSGISFATIQADYPLSAADYMQLKNGWVSVHGWALNVGFATFGYALSIFPKIFSSFFGGSEVVNKGEWVTLGLGVVVVLALYLLGFFLPSDKKIIMKAISDHFKTTPKTRQPVRH